MSSLLVVVKSHLFPQFEREALAGATGVTASLRPSIAGGRTRYSGAIYTAAIESIAMDGQSIGSKVAAAVTHNSDSQ